MHAEKSFCVLPTFHQNASSHLFLATFVTTNQDLQQQLIGWFLIVSQKRSIKMIDISLLYGQQLLPD